MDTPVILPDNDIFDHEADPRAPFACGCGPFVDLVPADALEDLPAEITIVHPRLAPVA